MDYKVRVRYLRIGRRKIARLLPFIKGEYVNHAIANFEKGDKKRNSKRDISIEEY